MDPYISIQKDTRTVCEPCKATNHSGLAWGCSIFKKNDFLVDMGSFNIQTAKKERIFKFSKSIVQKK
jgi:hypothetical protein